MFTLANNGSTDLIIVLYIHIYIFPGSRNVNVRYSNIFLSNDCRVERRVEAQVQEAAPDAGEKWSASHRHRLLVPEGRH